MLTLFTSRKRTYFNERAQAMAEFAITLPILLAVLVGIFEAGRMVFIYAAVNNASREAVRYASAVGLNEAGTAEKYRDCDGIKSMATRSAFFTSLTITITYDHGPGSAPFHTCTGSIDTTGFKINDGTNTDRVNVAVTATYRPLIRLIPFSQRPFTSTSARTILGILKLSYP